MSYNSKYSGAQVEALLDSIGGSTPVIDHGTDDVVLELTANALHKWGSIDALSLSLPEGDGASVSEYQVVFTASSSDFTLSLPAILRWSNGTMPTFTAGQQYELNIRDGRILWSQFNPPTPEGEELEYVQSDGSDYVMTDIYMSDKMYGMRCKAAPLFASGQSSNYAIVGTRQTSGSAAATSFFMWFLSGTQGRMLYWNGSAKDAFGSFADGTAYEDEWTGEQNNVASDYPLVVFGGNNAGTPSYNNKFRFYYVELLDSNGNAIVNLRPFRRASDGAVGLLDKVSGIFYPSVNGSLTGA